MMLLWLEVRATSNVVYVVVLLRGMNDMLRTFYRVCFLVHIGETFFEVPVRQGQ